MVVPPAHPVYAVMVAKAIIGCGHFGKAVSRQAILKYIIENFKVVDDKASTQLGLALKRLIISGKIEKDGAKYKLTAVGKDVIKPKKVVKKKVVIKKKVVKKAVKKPIKKKVVKKVVKKKVAPKKAKKVVKKKVVKKPKKVVKKKKVAKK